MTAPTAPAPASYRVTPLKMESWSHINYSYLIVDRISGEAAIVDPAWDVNRIFAQLVELGGRLTTILLTHAHYDHINLVPRLAERFPLRVVISREESGRYPFRGTNLTPLEHLDRLQLGGTTISTLLTPGHTAGSMCYLFPECVFTGDTLFVEGCGSCASEGGSPEAMFESLQLLKRTVSDRARVFPGHCYGSPVGRTMEEVRRENIYLHLDRKDDFVGFRMRPGQLTALEVASP